MARQPLSIERLGQLLGDYRQLAALNSRLTEELERRDTPRFDPLGTLGLGEVHLSAILADLLDPRGTHGQGTLFIDRFFELEPFPNWLRNVDWKGTRARTEAPTYLIERTSRRMDVLLRLTDRSYVAMENKFGAGEQPEQLPDYLEHLKRLAGTRDYLLVFLTPEGVPPGDPGFRTTWEAEKADQRAAELSYRHHVLQWVRRCRENVKAESVIGFLHHLERYIEKELGMENAAASDEIVVKFVTESRERLDTAVQIMNARQAVIQHLVAGFFDRLGARLVEELGDGWQFKNEFEGPAGLEKHRGAFVTKPSWPETALVKLEAQGREATNLIIGVKMDRAHPLNSSVQETLRRRLDHLRESSQWWACYRRMDPRERDLNTSAMLIEMLPDQPGEDALTDHWFREAVEIARAVEAAIES